MKINKSSKDKCELLLEDSIKNSDLVAQKLFNIPASLMQFLGVCLFVSVEVIGKWFSLIKMER